jgi:hypothetical protein
MREPLTDEEYTWVSYIRRSMDYPPEGTAERERWENIYHRFHAQILQQAPERAAWHEAGHIVVAHRLGATVVRIRQDEGDAITDILEFEPPFVPLALWAVVMTAGYLVEGRVFGCVDPSEASEVGVAYDRELAPLVGRHATPEEVLGYVSLVEGQANAILDEYWEAVARVAGLILREALPIDRDTLLPALLGIPNGDALPC